jgi:hypothetical protein
MITLIFRARPFAGNKTLSAECRALHGGKAAAPDSPESQPPKEGIMKKSIFVAMTASAVIASGLGFASPAAASVPSSEPAQTVTVTPPVSLVFKSASLSKKMEDCFAEGDKFDQPQTRPVDPSAKCKGKVKVKLVAKAFGFCPAPWQGGTASSRAKLVNVVKVKAYAKTVAVGRAWSKVKTKIKMKVAKVKAKAKVTCVAPPGVNPPPPVIPCPPGSIFDPVTNTCAKDGSTTPPPPSDAPGPNPQPTPGPGGGGPSECYDPQTGLPVPPGTPGAWCAA